jgi:hypothetical protein
MKIVFGICLVLLTIGNVEALGEPYDSGDGIYLLPYASNGAVTYQVDTVSQICFVLWYNRSKPTLEIGGIATIPCANLAKRSEWKSIITWVKPA